MGTLPSHTAREGVPLGEWDQRLLRRAIELSAEAVSDGNLPFGALLAFPDGAILLEARNTVITGVNPLNHAETNLVNLAVATLEPSQIESATLYTSCEPCPMCSGAMYWGGINWVVYGISEVGLLRYTGTDPLNPTMRSAGCRSILNRGQRHIEVIGPRLADEAAAVHQGYWKTATGRPGS